MKRIAIGLIAAGFLAVSSAALAVDGGSGGTATSAHNATNAKGTCAKCHIPHGGKGDKIWAQPLTNATAFAGIHTLCNSCHYTGNSFGASSGITAPSNNVFVLNAYQNHSMLQWATITGSISMPAGFPLNATDVDTLWTATADPDGVGVNAGFYCGTCHNPHKQPVFGGTVTTNGNGDYLRADAAITTLAAFGTSGARDGACTQCHDNVFAGTVSTGHVGNCTQCHSPHKGRTLAAANAQLAEKILTVSIVGNAFTATPNVTGFTGLYVNTIAAVCHGCHKAVTPTGGLPAGSTKLLTSINEHHPMGVGALAGAGTHAPGYTLTEGAGNFGCPSCHDPHNGNQDYYLKAAAGTYTGTDSDDGGFCTDVCHSNKSVAALGDATLGGHNRGVGYWTGGRGQCYMCHFIHDGGAPTGRGAVARADINSLMRIAPINFAAALTNADTDVNDYEDMCYGCHSSAVITKGVGTIGSTLQENGAIYFTHLFTGVPSADVLTRMTAQGYPVAAATATGGGEYGAAVGQVYCGSCHNVHVQIAGDEQGQMFRNVDNAGATLAAMCVDCHSAAGMTAGKSHPTYLDAGYNTALPVLGRTVDPIPAGFGSGGDGVAGGRTGGSTPGGTVATGEMSCETCHNFHTASTSRLGNIVETGAPVAANRGKLLVQDNMGDATGSTMCRNCHGGSY